MGEKVERFEDLVVWQMARTITVDVYRLTNAMEKRDYGFCDQVRRAAVSVMNNIAEGYDRGSNKDFAKFLFIARGSCGEIRSMLYVALDQHYIDQQQFDQLIGQCRQCSAGIWGLIKSLTRSSGWIERGQLIPVIVLSLLRSSSL